MNDDTIKSIKHLMGTEGDPNCIPYFINTVDSKSGMVESDVGLKLIWILDQHMRYTQFRISSSRTVYVWMLNSERVNGFGHGIRLLNKKEVVAGSNFDFLVYLPYLWVNFKFLHLYDPSGRPGLVLQENLFETLPKLVDKNGRALIR